MAIVSLKIGPRFYKFSCNDGQEMHMKELADALDKRAEQLLKSIGFMQEGQLLAMICLLLAEEKYALEQGQGSYLAPEISSQMVHTIDMLTDKIKTLTESLTQ